MVKSGHGNTTARWSVPHRPMPMERGRIPRGPSCEMKTRGVGSVAPDCHRVAEGHGGPLGG